MLTSSSDESILIAPPSKSSANVDKMYGTERNEVTVKRSTRSLPKLSPGSHAATAPSTLAAVIGVSEVG